MLSPVSVTDLLRAVGGLLTVVLFPSAAYDWSPAVAAVVGLSVAPWKNFMSVGRCAETKRS